MGLLVWKHVLTPIMSLSGMAAMEGRVTDKVMIEFNEEYKRKAGDEYKHTTNHCGAGYGGAGGKEGG